MVLQLDALTVLGFLLELLLLPPKVTLGWVHAPLLPAGTPGTV